METTSGNSFGRPSGDTPVIELRDGTLAGPFGSFDLSEIVALEMRSSKERVLRMFAGAFLVAGIISSIPHISSLWVLVIFGVALSTALCLSLWKWTDVSLIAVTITGERELMRVKGSIFERRQLDQARLAYRGVDEQMRTRHLS